MCTGARGLRESQLFQRREGGSGLACEVEGLGFDLMSYCNLGLSLGLSYLLRFLMSPPSICFLTEVSWTPRPT